MTLVAKVEFFWQSLDCNDNARIDYAKSQLQNNCEHIVYQVCNLLNVREETRGESGAGRTPTTERQKYLGTLASTLSSSMSEIVRGPTTSL